VRIAVSLKLAGKNKCLILKPFVEVWRAEVPW